MCGGFCRGSASCCKWRTGTTGTAAAAAAVVYCALGRSFRPVRNVGWCGGTPQPQPQNSTGAAPALPTRARTNAHASTFFTSTNPKHQANMNVIKLSEASDMRSSVYRMDVCIGIHRRALRSHESTLSHFAETRHPSSCAAVASAVFGDFWEHGDKHVLLRVFD